MMVTTEPIRPEGEPPQGAANASTLAPPASAVRPSGDRGRDAPRDADATLSRGQAEGGEARAVERVSPAARYELLGSLGRGGMGEVYEARDNVLGRHVAIKFLLGATADRVMRLFQEARAQARVDHPNVCKVHEVGELEGKPFIAMQLVRGKPLGEMNAELSLPEKVQIMRLVAEAVHEAHRLGIIHRDLKPSNVLLGHDDGRWVPMVTDFGLAHDFNQSHLLTGTWALMGTPAYMAPEQARGEVRSIDRRSDIYGLGATFYELLTGEPPFADTPHTATLYRVINEEPKPPRDWVPRLPVDLETIALKCLHKEPDQRYPTAKALAEDLGRYLEGEPIVGRRPRLAERLQRWGRKHRPLVTVSALSLAATLSFAGLSAGSWLEARRARAEASDRARLAQELGQKARDIEWFLHAAYGRPLHDTTPERRYVRERMGEIAALGRQAGALGEGLAHYALGRGHLALGEFAEAHDELSLALRQGVTSPELSYARGRALGELYRQALEAAQQSGGREWAAGRQKDAEARYLTPALEALEQSRGVKAESPLYLEGLIALYRGDYDDAARAAEQATATTPWAYEARKLAGDAAFARASERRARGDYGEAREGFDEAIGLYERALEFGRSDARIYEAIAATWLERAEIDRRQGKPRREAADRALAAASRAIEADPQSASAHVAHAFALMNHYKWRSRGDAPRNEREDILDQWFAAARRAVELNPYDPYADDALANAYHRRGLLESGAGLDPMRSWSEAARWAGKALELEPAFPKGLNDLGVIHLSKGNHLDNHWEDPRDAFTEAERNFRAAVKSDPSYVFAYANLGDVHAKLAAYELSRGRSPEQDVDRALEASERAIALDPRYFASSDRAAFAELLRAEYLTEVDRDPGPSLRRAFGFVDRSLSLNATFGRAWFYRAQGHYLAARHALRAGGEPQASFASARQAVNQAYHDEPSCGDCAVIGSRLLELEATRAAQQGRPPAPLLRRALDEVEASLRRYPDSAEAHQQGAHVFLRLAEAEPPGAATHLVSEGLAHAERALALAPGLAEARAVRGALLFARARSARDAATRSEATRLASAELERALEHNPLLRRDYEGALRAARSLGLTPP